MSDYRVQLDVYHGPLDLLLYLIKRDEIDLDDIPVHHVTEQYLAYVETLKALDMDLAGEFMVMAATLVEIKSAMMARMQDAEDADPDAETDAEVEDPTDPRFELVQQLLAYKRFKDAAMALDKRRALFADRFVRKPAKYKPDEEEDQAPPELDLEDISVWDLLETFNTLLEQVGGPPLHSVTVDDTPIELHAADISDRLKRDGPMTLQQMFVGRRNVQEMLGLFLALLELLRQRKVRAKQDRIAGEIHVELRPESERRAEAEAEEAASQFEYDPNDADNFDWPDEGEYKRYARRIERRLKGESVEEDEELEAEIRELEEAEGSLEAELKAHRERKRQETAATENSADRAADNQADASAAIENQDDEEVNENENNDVDER